MEYQDIDKFTKQHDYLICIDSDGTAMDAMNVKHKKCFGPCIVTEWELEKYSDEVLKIWNEINLYSSTRGVNRFIGLVEILRRLNGKYLSVTEYDILKKWVENAPELSNKCLKEEIQKNDCIILNKALKWSLAVNAEISKLTADDNKPFDGVKECLAFAYDKVDIAVISSANMSAIAEEWNHYDMQQYLGVMTAQEIGTKGECISKMIQKGYDAIHVLMIGDAYPDLDAAKINEVYFYPILADQEKECWAQLKDFYLNEFLSGDFSKHQDELLHKFSNIFNK